MELPEKYRLKKSFTLFELMEILPAAAPDRLIQDGTLESYRTRAGHIRVKCAVLEDYLAGHTADKSKMPRKTLLVIDDDPGVLSVLKRWIPELFPQIDVFSSESAFEGGQLAEEIMPDFLIIDIMMPGMNGIQASGIFREYNPDMTIIAVSGFPEHLSEVTSAGADCFIAKPFESVTIRETIKRFL